jgi:flagellar hook-basal body complex protein FliE
MGNEMSASIGAVQMRIEREVHDLSRTIPAAAVDAPDSAELGGGGVSFSEVLKQAIHGVDDQQRVAAEKMQAVDNGSSDDLVGTMLASQTASLSFSMLMQMRNKVAGAMDELIKLSL